MSETETASAPATSTTSPKKAAKKKASGSTAAAAAAKKTKAKPTHPKTADMVTAAIKNLKERRGSSLQAIKKYIGANYKVDAEKFAPFIRKYLKAAVTSGSLVQTKGKGASGSFKLPPSAEKAPAKKKPIKVASPKKSPDSKVKKTKVAPPKKSPVKKSASSSPKKAPVKEKQAKAASQSKTKKTIKSTPLKKAKVPKQKKNHANDESQNG